MFEVSYVDLNLINVGLFGLKILLVVAEGSLLRAVPVLLESSFERVTDLSTPETS